MLERGSSPTNRLSCGNQPAHIRLINRRHAARSATRTLYDDFRSLLLKNLTGQYISATEITEHTEKNNWIVECWRYAKEKVMSTAHSLCVLCDLCGLNLQFPDYFVAEFQT